MDKRRIVKTKDCYISGYSVDECRELSDIAKELRNSAPFDMKLGTFSMKTCTNGKLLKVLGILLIVWIIRKVIISLFNKDGSDGKSVQSEAKPSKMESLNETIGKNAENPNEMRVVGNLIRYGGINLIFSPTGEGKSVLAMQLGIDIAGGKGSQILPEEDRHSIRPIFTIVYDEEQDEDDIVERYGHAGIQFPERLQRIESCMFDNEAMLLNDISMHVTKVQDDICVIIDNVTSIIPSMSGNKVRCFYNHLKKIQREKKESGFRVTFIIVAHTIKGYSNPISLRDLSGTANNSNFLNRAIALLPTKLGEDVKILKILKSRDALKGDGIVIRMVNEPYIHFEYEGAAELKDAMSAEMLAKVDRLLNDEGGECQERSPQNPPSLSKEQRKAEILKWYESGMTQKKMAQKLRVSEMTISRDIEEMREGGLLKDISNKGNNPNN